MHETVMDNYHKTTTPYTHEPGTSTYPDSGTRCRPHNHRPRNRKKNYWRNMTKRNPNVAVKFFRSLLLYAHNSSKQDKQTTTVKELTILKKQRKEYNLRKSTNPTTEKKYIPQSKQKKERNVQVHSLSINCGPRDVLCGSDSIL